MAVQKIIGIWLVKIFFRRKLFEKLLVLEIDGHLNAGIQIWTLNFLKCRIFISLGSGWNFTNLYILVIRGIHNMSNKWNFKHFRLIYGNVQHVLCAPYLSFVRTQPYVYKKFFQKDYHLLSAFCCDRVYR